MCKTVDKLVKDLPWGFAPRCGRHCNFVWFFDAICLRITMVYVGGLCESLFYLIVRIWQKEEWGSLLTNIILAMGSLIKNVKCGSVYISSHKSLT